MSYSKVVDYTYSYLNPDGTWETSGFKAHWDAEIFLDFTHYSIPAVLYYGS